MLFIQFIENDNFLQVFNYQCYIDTDKMTHSKENATDLGAFFISYNLKIDHLYMLNGSLCRVNSTNCILCFKRETNKLYYIYLT